MSPQDCHISHCQGAILVYDITSAKSLERLNTWHKELDKFDSEEGMVSCQSQARNIQPMREQEI